MAKKKDRAFFICPRWNEMAGAAPNTVPPKVSAMLAAGKPVARSTLRKALHAASAGSGRTLDVDAYIVDSRAAR